MLFPLFLFHDDCSFHVQVVFFFQYIVKGWISTSINADLLEFIPEVVLDRLLFKRVALHYDVVFSLEHEAVEYEVFFF